MGSAVSIVCHPGVDDVLKPLTNPCRRDGKDFTLAYKDFLLTIVPSAILIPVTAARVVFLSRQLRKTRRIPITTARRYTKLWVTGENKSNRFFLSASLSALAGTCCLFLLSFLEHDYSATPSTVIILFLLGSCICDIPIIIALWRHQDFVTLSLLRTGSLVAKAIVFLLESMSKKSYLEADFSQKSPEVLSGIINRILFLWLIYYNPTRL
ncbi:hypothetical protein LX32DRAFT_713675 [Colletotrichum zoysiae]|uniref:Uncharacterized protein n=1 Tax=Colletotrichum zoysiae TaxID=1216348 RepID=A0AAD9HNW7_9PEZI|nr:hypothetical protein LX32DRAFT_713675 [Colletotrichum zoysiae]